jgi:hypothetical protein
MEARAVPPKYHGGRTGERSWLVVGVPVVLTVSVDCTVWLLVMETCDNKNRSIKGLRFRIEKFIGRFHDRDGRSIHAAGSAPGFTPELRLLKQTADIQTDPLRSGSAVQGLIHVKLISL